MSAGPPDVATLDHDPLIGRTIAGKFVIESLLGAGSMGAVYRAQQVALERTIAIKVMRGGIADATSAARFHLEAKAASRLDHPNVIRVFDYGQEPDGLLYIAMEFLDCRDLYAVLDEEWPLSHERLTDILSQTLSALADAHESGVLHRDLKPENIMLVRRKADDGTLMDLVKVCDFGIAKITKASPGTAPALAPPGRPLTTGGLVIGTPEYMAPEQARGESFDARSDLYAIGVILYQLLTRRLPFEAGTPVEVVFKVMHEDPPPLGSWGPTGAPGLTAVCEKAMSKRPEDRFQSAREMRAALRAAKTIEVPPLAPTGDALPPSPRGSRSKKWASLGAVLVVGAAAVMIVRRAPGPSVVGQPAAPRLASAPAAAPSMEASAQPGEPALASALVNTDPAGPPSQPTAEHRTTREPRRAPAVVPSPQEGPSAASALAPSSFAAAVLAPGPSVLPAPSVAPVSPAPAAPDPPPRAAPRRYDQGTARVDLGTVKTNNASATVGNVSRALRPLVGRFTACYREALARGSLAEGEMTGSLHLESDDAGYVTVARLTGEVPSGAAVCIETISRSARIVVDTGTANADVTLTFKPL